MTHKPLPDIQREILTYLAGTPQHLMMLGNSAAADLCLNLGNCFCWIAHKIDGSETKQIDQGLAETPQTVYALGKQFREVALTFSHHPETQRGREKDAIEALQEQMRGILTQFADLKAKQAEGKL